ncbi:MAG: hypothetical protein H6767_06140 [Candidatus Peribacteria bacterium]|nr:MAG: hypothetical protein H6767_06140 [Candidatus Peribacteria bacterium]
MNEGSQSPEGYESCNDIIEVLKSPIVFHALKDMYTQAGNKGELILISQE